MSSLKIGIVGLPNVGKSTLFNALTKKNVPAENYPFCTIDPSVGIVPVPDERLTKLSEISKSQKTIPAVVEFVDIAGLVKGANEGQGLGNKFLAHIREVDAIIEVVRLFPDPNVIHVSGAISPKDDVETINTELMLADLQMMEKHVPKVEKESKTNPKLKPIADFGGRVKQHLEQGNSIRNIIVTYEEKIWLKELQLMSAKPILYVANIEVSQLNDESALAPLRAIASVEGANLVAIDAKIEAEVAELNPAEQTEYIKELGLDEPGLNKVIKSGYKLLNLITFLTT